VRSTPGAVARANVTGPCQLVSRALLWTKPGTLDAAAERLGATSDALALAAVLARPWVDVVLSGAATREQLLSNLGALDLPWSAELDDELAGLAQPSERYWSTRSGMSWT
jgi:aryl-alcohol dehydrogenase-like predicted oxidoreductase